eukprot:6182604-Pleurochrysis_carterae.AAC.3
MATGQAIAPFAPPLAAPLAALFAPLPPLLRASLRPLLRRAAPSPHGRTPSTIRPHRPCALTSTRARAARQPAACYHPPHTAAARTGRFPQEQPGQERRHREARERGVLKSSSTSLSTHLCVDRSAVRAVMQIVNRLNKSKVEKHNHPSDLAELRAERDKQVRARRLHSGTRNRDAPAYESTPCL